MIFKIFGKSSQVFGNIQEFSENFGNDSNVIFRCFYEFLKFSEILGDIFTSEDMENILRGTRIFRDKNVSFHIWTNYSIQDLYREWRANQITGNSIFSVWYLIKATITSGQIFVD